MNLTDWDRKLLCEEKGYEVKLYSMNPYECTPKNNFLFGIKLHSGWVKINSDEVNRKSDPENRFFADHNFSFAWSLSKIVYLCFISSANAIVKSMLHASASATIFITTTFWQLLLACAAKKKGPKSNFSTSAFSKAEIKDLWSLS